MRSDPPTSPRCAVYARRSGSSILSGRHQTDPGRERTMVAAATETVQLQQTTVTGGKSKKKSAPRITPERKLQKQHSNRPRRGGKKKRNEKGTVPSSLAFFFFPSRPLKALHVGLSEALFQPSPLLIRKCCRHKRPNLQNDKKGQGKGLIFVLKSAIFTTFSSSSSTSSFLLHPI